MSTTPFRFDNLLGQDKAKNLLRGSIRHHKLAHGYLFRGPEGVGKNRCAITLAAYLNCHNPAAEDACGECPSCRKLRSGNHPDLIRIRPDGTAIKIAQIRELIHLLAFPPHESNWRVVIVEDVHTMRQEAANSLLKTLEEPPDGNLLVLVSGESTGLLPTIVSRCQIIPFYPLAREEIIRLLLREHGMEPETASVLAAAAAGSPGRALGFAHSELLELRRQIIEFLAGRHNAEPEGVAAVMLLAEKAAALKEQLPELLELLKTWFRDLMLLAAGAPQSHPAKQDLSQELNAARRRWDLQEIMTRLARIDQAQKALARNCSRGLVCEILFFDLV